MRALALIAAMALLAGCGSFSIGKPSGGTVVVRCPASLPAEPTCEACEAWKRPEIDSLEDQAAALDLTEAALVECQTRAQACVARDGVIGRTWQTCGE